MVEYKNRPALSNCSTTTRNLHIVAAKRMGSGELVFLKLKLQTAADEIMANICSYSGAEEVAVSVRVEEKGAGNIKKLAP